MKVNFFIFLLEILFLTHMNSLPKEEAGIDNNGLFNFYNERVNNKYTSNIISANEDISGQGLGPEITHIARNIVWADVISSCKGEQEIKKLWQFQRLRIATIKFFLKISILNMISEGIMERCTLGNLGNFQGNYGSFKTDCLKFKFSSNDIRRGKFNFTLIGSISETSDMDYSVDFIPEREDAIRINI